MGNLEKALKFPFTQKNWENKFALLFLAYLFLSLVSSFTDTGAQFTKEFGTNFRPENLRDLSEIVSHVRTFNIISAIILGILTTPVALYLSGFFLSLTYNVMSKKEEVLGEVSSFGEYIKLGFVKFGLSIPVGLISIFVMAIIIAAGVAVTVALDTTSLSVGSGAWIPVVGIWGVVFLLILALSFAAHLLNTSIIYNYLKKPDFWAALNYQRVMKTFSAGWKEFLGVIGWGFVIGIGTMIVRVTLCCLSFVVTPALNLYTTMVIAYLYGLAFQRLSDRKV
jgi:hypothetical protein